MKKLPSKVAHDRPATLFLCTGRAAQTAQKQKSRTTKSPLMQDWVFRLGSCPQKREFTLLPIFWPLRNITKVAWITIYLFRYGITSNENMITQQKMYNISNLPQIHILCIKMDFKIHVIYILCLILLLTSSNCEQTPCDIQEDFQTVAVSKARGRIGNHIWMYMKLMAVELQYGIKGESFSEPITQCFFQKLLSPI